MATGWGRKTWGASDWGDLSNETVSVSGIALSSSIGSETITADGNVSVTGSQITLTNAGAVGGTSVSLNLTGIQATFSVGQAVQNIGVPVTSAGQLQSTIGTATVDETKLTGEGWGRDAWGSFVWGDNYSVQVTGLQMTLTGGEESAGTDFTAEITGGVCGCGSFRFQVSRKSAEKGARVVFWHYLTTCCNVTKTIHPWRSRDPPGVVSK